MYTHVCTRTDAHTHTHTCPCVLDAALVYILLITVVKTLTQGNLGKKGVICFILHNHSSLLKEASQELKQRLWRNAAWLGPFGFLRLAFYKTQSRLCRGGTTRHGLGLLLITSQENFQQAFLQAISWRRSQLQLPLLRWLLLWLSW